MAQSSRLSGLRNLSVVERRNAVIEAVGLDADALAPLAGEGLSFEQADRMIENVIGKIEIPVGIATNITINGKDVLVPMATEEPSVVAAASNIARMSRRFGGIVTTSTEPLMQAQVQLLDVADPAGASARILENKDEILALANEQDPRLVQVGGGARDLLVRRVHGLLDEHLIVHLVVNVGDAMGANAVNTMAEAIAPRLAEIAGGRSLLRILTNLADMRITRARLTIHTLALGSPGSTSGDALPMSALADAGIADEVTADYAGGHPEALLALVNGTVDAAQINSQTLATAEAEGTIDTSEFRQVWKSEEIPNDPITVRGNLPQEFKDAVAEALLSLDADDVAQVSAFLGVDPAGPLIPVTVDTYQPLFDLAKTMGLTEEDV